MEKPNIPFGLGVLSHGVANDIDLFPALAPFVGIPLLGDHIDNLKVVTPASHVIALILEAVALNGPFACSLQLHDTAADIRRDYENDLASAAERGTMVDVHDSCYG